MTAGEGGRIAFLPPVDKIGLPVIKEGGREGKEEGRREWREGRRERVLERGRVV